MIPQDVPDTKQEVEDELYDEAVQLVVEMQTASVSMLQRRFRVGYTRAARLIDAMEMNGVVCMKVVNHVKCSLMMYKKKFIKSLIVLQLGFLYAGFVIYYIQQ